MYVYTAILFEAPIKRKFNGAPPPPERIPANKIDFEFTDGSSSPQSSYASNVEPARYGFHAEQTEAGIEITYRQSIPGILLWVYLIVLSFVPLLQIIFIPLLFIYFFTNFLFRLAPKKILISDGVIEANGRRLAINNIQTIKIYNPVLKRVGVTGETNIVWNLFAKPAANAAYHIVAEYGVSNFRIAKHLSLRRAENMLGLIIAILREQGW